MGDDMFLASPEAFPSAKLKRAPTTSPKTHSREQRKPLPTPLEPRMLARKAPQERPQSAPNLAIPTHGTAPLSTPMLPLPLPFAPTESANALARSPPDYPKDQNTKIAPPVSPTDS